MTRLYRYSMIEYLIQSNKKIVPKKKSSKYKDKNLDTAKISFVKFHTMSILFCEFRINYTPREDNLRYNDCSEKIRKFLPNQTFGPKTKLY
jgi:hypothetical protein